MTPMDFSGWHRTQGVPTDYNHITFRSKTEARWAVFFDRLGIKYEYEAPVELQGEDADSYTGAVEYTAHPDFWLPQISMWTEVKSDQFDEDEVGKARVLATQSFRGCILLAGQPACKEYRLVVSQHLDADRFDRFTFAEAFGIGESEVREAARAARSATFGTKKQPSGRPADRRHGSHGTEETAIPNRDSSPQNPKVERLPEAGPAEMAHSAASPYSHWIEKADRDLECSRCGR